MSVENNNNKKNNNKKNEKKKTTESTYSFLDKQGFYIILLVCICIVGVAAIWSSREPEDDFYFSESDWNDFEDNYNRPDVTLVENHEDDGEQDQAVMGNESREETDEKEDEQKDENVEKSVDASVEAEDETEPDETEPDEEEQAQAEEETQWIHSVGNYNMTLPVMGTLGMHFAEDELVEHRTLNHWATHKGIDLHAEEGTPVRAALEGEVIEVVTDQLMGITITLQHDENLLTRYSNLSTPKMVAVGDHVEKGQVISGVGTTASIKKVEGPLLHFQVVYDTRPVDPQIYLPKIE
ncbi:peptidoglycan DD-metalloendopeptidase family protein [Serpentinicella sp. ANB-PHB4]|uniref:peptidoglycan DD-metalloendopeptidase family protein n=1 Tax=Serpentinicella sp. ANB-PHB4 TaxID=3074076 RepID=UPI002860BC2E|nr:peptidoglycan DD-metalloendopeptidase family protein [Serpentinicella sp. ANB-PHB4]MDR5659705.1 peptidoglycan DD-metalloendopeptidase family protein [Serpentinicella sp. ANB-PHB4]